jgi:cephalosporin-C deacetylase-like acetyl esterase
MALALAARLAAQTPAPASPYLLTAVTDRADALYAVGEQVKFNVNLKKDGAPMPAADVAWQLDKDGMPPVTKGVAKIVDGAAVVTGTLTEPGFLACRLTFVTPEQKPLRAVAAAGFEPTKLGLSLPVPDDFDEFWAKQKAALRATPCDATLTPAPFNNAGVECFDVQIPCLQWRPVSAYLARPKGAAPKSLPIILSVHGAGVRSSNLNGAAWTALGYKALAMDLNANGLPNGRPDAYYKELDNTVLKDYPHQGNTDREKCYFLGMFLRLVRALDYLTSQPEWDGRHLIVMGGSQGGGQSLAAAGLDPRVTLICAGVPAICDHSGKVIGRANGWPRLVPDKGGQPDPQILQVARYFDGVNFATRSKAEAVLSVGFIDTVCAPSSVFAAYNALPTTKKQIVCEPLMGHNSTPRIGAAFDAAVRRHLADK